MVEKVEPEGEHEYTAEVSFKLLRHETEYARAARRQAQELAANARWAADYQFWSAVLQGITLVAVIAAALVYYRQFGAMRAQLELATKQWDAIQKQIGVATDANKVASESLTLANRAWVVGTEEVVRQPGSTDPGGAGVDIQPGYPVRAEFTIQNMGYSPAVVQILTATTLTPDVLTSDWMRTHLDEQGTPRSKVALGPGDTAVVPIDSSTLWLEQVDKIEAGTLHLYFYAIVKYQGPLVELGETSFCRELTRDSASGKVSLTACADFDEFR